MVATSRASSVRTEDLQADEESRAEADEDHGHEHDAPSQNVVEVMALSR